MRRALKVCAEPGCPETVVSGRCNTHRRATDRARGTRQQRGYDAEHERLRKLWAPKVQRGGVHCHAVVCLMPARLILPGQRWHLDHDDDRNGHRGPAHARCNTSAGGRAAHGG